MKNFKIGYFADGPWSHKAFEMIAGDKSLEVCFIVPRSDTKDETLKNYAAEHSIDYLHPVNVNSSEFIKKADAYNCDLYVSMSFNQIFKKKTIDLPKNNTINCHAGKLPFYRGRNVLNWALINDEDEFGITVHFVDETIDTGDIILQQTYPITDQDNYRSLLDTAYDGCAQLLYTAIKKIQADDYQRTRQEKIHPVGSYCGRRKAGDEIIDWNNKSRYLFNFIRALAKPGPMATTFIDGEIVKINKANLIEDAPVYVNTPGQVLKRTKDGVLVKTDDTFIEILEIESDSKLKVGSRFEYGEL